jgi:hypothetical protein
MKETLTTNEEGEGIPSVRLAGSLQTSAASMSLKARDDGLTRTWAVSRQQEPFYRGAKVLR